MLFKCLLILLFPVFFSLFCFDLNFLKFADTIYCAKWKCNGIVCSHGGSKTKALSYLRDTPADASVPVTMDGELNLKITFIDGKRSPDRSWRTVTAEIRGTKLKMTIHREGKSNQVSTRFIYFFSFFVPFLLRDYEHISFLLLKQNKRAKHVQSLIIQVFTTF